MADTRPARPSVTDVFYMIRVSFLYAPLSHATCKYLCHPVLYMPFVSGARTAFYNTL